jgi:glycosyltransferase involved in cell wall biosynthesis
MHPMRICHFTSVHPWNDIRIFHKECVSLAAMGHDVTLVAVGEKDDDFVLQGVRVVTLVNSFTGRGSRALRFSGKVVSSALNIDADIYHFHDPELLPYAKRFVRLSKKVVYDVHEDLPRQISTKPWIPKLFRGLAASIAEWMENHLVKGVSGVVAATPHIEKRFQLLTSRTCCVFNAPLLREFSLQSTPSYSSRKLVYIGLISEKRGILTLLHALENINGRLQLAGKFESDQLLAHCKNMPAWKKVDYHGVLDRAAIAGLLCESSVGMVTLHPTTNYLESYPIKMFEYMGAALPVVASDFPLWKGIVEKHEAGVCVNPLDSEAIANAVNRLLDNAGQCRKMGEKGRKHILSEFNWEHEALKLSTFYETLMN